MNIWSTIKKELPRQKLLLVQEFNINKQQSKQAIYNQAGVLLKGDDFRAANEDLSALMQADFYQYQQAEGIIKRSELLSSLPTIFICGGGHIGICLYQLADFLDYQVELIDDRQEFANKCRFPKAVAIYAGSFQQLLPTIKIDEHHHIVIVTRGHLHDLECLKWAVATKASYIGMIGSSKKVSDVFKALESQGITKGQLANVFAPIGLEINSETPAEIALSIMAQIIKNRAIKKVEINWQNLLEVMFAHQKPLILATVIESSGNTPRKAGSRMLVNAEKIIWGTIGGGSLEEHSLQTALKMIDSSQRLEILTFDLNQELQAEEGMICGGKAKVLLQKIE